jgi:hypothetical protein
MMIFDGVKDAAVEYMCGMHSGKTNNAKVFIPGAHVYLNNGVDRNSFTPSYGSDVHM